MVNEGKFPKVETFPIIITPKDQYKNLLTEQTAIFEAKSDGRKHPMTEGKTSNETLEIFYIVLLLRALRNGKVYTDKLLPLVGNWYTFSKDIFNSTCQKVKNCAEKGEEIVLG